MKSSIKISAIFSGLLLMLAASPVAGQKAESDVAPKINKRPLQDMASYTMQKVEKKELDLSAPFSVEGVGTLNAEGKLDPATFKFTSIKGDAAMTDLVKQSVVAVNDSGYFQYLTTLGGHKELHLSIVQDDTAFTVAIILRSRAQEGPTQ